MGISKLSVLFLCLLLLTPHTVAAADLSVSPVVIDKEAKPRDILKGEFTIKNTTGHHISVFPDVREYAQGAGPSSMIPWVELSRGAIDLAEGESRQVPYLIHVNYDAKPGNYHAILWFGTGSFRSEAEANPGRATEILVNIKVLDDAIERLQLATFVPNKQIFPNEKTEFSFGVQNTGNRLIAPSGNLRIFDRRGREIAVVPVNIDRTMIPPDSRELLAAAWNADGKFGRYKAVIDLEYGGQGKQITDTTFFWVLPWAKTLSLFTGVSVAIVILAIMLHARGEARRRVFVPAVEETDEEAESPKNTFLEKFRAKQESQQREAAILPTRSRQEMHSHSPVHLAVNGAAQPPRLEPTRLQKHERPKDVGNVVRLSR
jgi:hypothetical protein